MDQNRIVLWQPSTIFNLFKEDFWETFLGSAKGLLFGPIYRFSFGDHLVSRANNGLMATLATQIHGPNSGLVGTPFLLAEQVHVSKCSIPCDSYSAC